MRIKAIVEIELKSDGKWVIVSLESLEPPVVTAPESEKSTVREHFRNLRRIREERIANAKGNTSPKHCSECGKVHHNVLTHEEHKEK